VKNIQFLDYQNSDLKSIYIDLTLIADITLVFLLLWYAVSRISRVMRSVNKITD
jgi:hypothetical protein